uniref:Sulfotransferase n=1 Tax=Serinus canaria TaxID=9135 RepID=A0A8C9MYQ8_SERCA
GVAAVGEGHVAGTQAVEGAAMMCRATPWCHGPALTPTSAGTTWMQEILTLLFSLGDARPAKTIPNWERAPWLEQIYSREALQNTGSPRLLTTHLGVQGNPPSCGGDTVSLQVIYVARNPKDVAVSFYHFHHLAKFLPDPSSFDAFLTQFLEGTVHYGSWFDHVKGWLGQRHLLDILYVTYEELHQVSPAVSPSPSLSPVPSSDSGETLLGLCGAVGQWHQRPATPVPSASLVNPATSASPSCRRDNPAWRLWTRPAPWGPSAPTLGYPSVPMGWGARAAPAGPRTGPCCSRFGFPRQQPGSALKG